jgi:phosphatidylinositol-4,5-bisphosphate 3-kinase
MDTIWREAGLDLRMNPYACLSMGDQVGLIEVVLKSSTIAKIQKNSSGAKGALDKKVLLAWLRGHNKTPAELNRAVENFTNSCAGCCVATYVLGIGDRHSDNIMLKENGQLVHIDFGHFLGNFKTKFGVKRERVPFVLTDDFIHIITREEGKSSYEFTKFRMLCEKAFMMLRQKGDLFITLFTLMLSTGIPELRSVDDIRYISNALCLSKSDDMAREDFNKKFQEAVKHSWSVTANWYIHNVARTGN